MALGSTFKGHQHLGAQQAKVTLNPTFTPDQNVIVAGQAMAGQQFTNQRTKPALHPVANHGIADFFGDSYAKPQTRAGIGADQQDKPRPSDSKAPVGR